METAVTGGSALSLAELSRRTGVSRSAVLRRLRSGDIEGATRGDDGRWEIPESAIEVILDRTPAPSDDPSDDAAVVDVADDGDATVDLRSAEVDTDPERVETMPVDDAPTDDAAVVVDEEIEPVEVAPAEEPILAEVAERPTPLTASAIDIRPPSLDPELERGLRAELADARKAAAVAEAVASERLETIETLRDALETIRQMLPAVDATPTTGRFEPLVDADDEYERIAPPVAVEIDDEPEAPPIVVESRDGDAEGEWVWQTSPTAEPKRDIVRRIFRRW